ncbi:MAG: PspC domain-containing protein [Candidatus Moraniibacteriota bacterium]
METGAPTKHLYRSQSNKVLAGICGGLGEYWNIDPVMLRLLWILVTVFTGFAPGVIAYVLAAFVVPVKSADSAVSQSPKP